MATRSQPAPGLQMNCEFTSWQNWHEVVSFRISINSLWFFFFFGGGVWGKSVSKWMNDGGNTYGGNHPKSVCYRGDLAKSVNYGGSQAKSVNYGGNWAKSVNYGGKPNPLYPYTNHLLYTPTKPPPIFFNRSKSIRHYQAYTITNIPVYQT